MKLTRRHMNALKYLSTVTGFVQSRLIPDGNGHTSKEGAVWATLYELEKDGLVEFGNNPNHSLWGYRITDAGREALKGGGE